MIQEAITTIRMIIDTIEVIRPLSPDSEWCVITRNGMFAGLRRCSERYGKATT